ncbi:TlyA family RNA methyltransferase [Agilicoccus flavus]|uniref:TlyA family RNA methyltransferase n=1 Tax=Agilicoccus flavus TaxID=2775968 RepID=UPI001CF653AA|nr:TlyA family RNA methyltransferase [Agilicoccus flavus]
MSSAGPEGWARLDVALVERGLARSRGHARDLVEAGRVRVDERPARRPALRVGPGAEVAVEAGDAYVGRAAHKLLYALDAFAPLGLEVAGRRCLDVGASTGGFTQVLLERGAREVVALDVGHGQLAAAVADDPRVLERSGVNVRDVAPGDLGDPFDLVVGDLSFISLTLVVAALAGQVAPAGDLVLLVKPQFEVGRVRLGKNGIVRSSSDRLDSVTRVVDAARAAGLRALDVRASPLPGGGGNREYLGWFTAGDRPAPARVDLAERIARLDSGPTDDTEDA